MVGAPLGVIFAAVGTIFCSERFWLTVMWSSRSSGGRAAAAGKEGSRATRRHVRKGDILYFHWRAADCSVDRVYNAGDIDRVPPTGGGGN